MRYVLIVLLILILGYGHIYWERKITWRLSRKVSKYLKWLHYLGLFVCATVAISYSNFDIGLRGLWTTRVIIIFTLITGIFFIFVVPKSSLNPVESSYFRILSFLPLLAAVLLLVPFIGGLIILSIYEQLTDPATEIYFEDEKIRVQTTFVGPLGPPRIDIFEKNTFTETHLKGADFWTNEIDSIKVSYDQDSTRIHTYGLYDYDDKRKGEIKTICLPKPK